MEDSDGRSNSMKRKWLCVVALALAAVLCTGCGVKDENLKSDPLVNPDGTAPLPDGTVPRTKVWFYA